MSEDIQKIIEDTSVRMNKALDSLSEKFKTLRTGRVSSAIFDKIMVEYYGTPTPLKQVAQVSFPEARMAVIQAFDKTVIVAIEKAISASELGVNPSNDGNVVRINFPALTEQTRKDEVKKGKAMAEEAKVALRNTRRDINEAIKKAQKDKLLTEDEAKKEEEKIQKLTDEFIKKVDASSTLKEKEILED